MFIDSVVGAVTTLQAKRSWVRVPAQGKICIFSETSSPALVPTHLPIQCAHGVCCRVKAAGVDQGDHSSPSSTHIRMSGSIPLLPLMLSCRGRGHFFPLLMSSLRYVYRNLVYMNALIIDPN